MKKRGFSLLLIFLIFGLIFSLSFVSASIFSDLFGKSFSKITGNAGSETCTDTDGGKVYTTPGFYSLGSDNCVNAYYLTEYYCEGGILKNEYVPCEHGCYAGACNTADHCPGTCNSAKSCMALDNVVQVRESYTGCQIDKSYCYDSDNPDGNSGQAGNAVKGAVYQVYEGDDLTHEATGKFLREEDSCVDANTLKEAFCGGFYGGYPQSLNINCKYGCSNGVCNSIENELPNDYIIQNGVAVVYSESDFVWTGWIDSSDPWTNYYNSKNEYEQLGDIQRVSPEKVCPSPFDVECRTVGTQISSSVRASQGEEVRCLVPNGLTCFGSRTTPCPDYEVRFKCLKGWENGICEKIGGQNLYQKGYVAKNGQAVEYDECGSDAEGQYVLEKDCNVDGTIKTYKSYCPYNYPCVEGRCNNGLPDPNNAPSVVDKSPRVSFWPGKLSQHTEDGVWVTTGHGVTAGASVDKLQFCRSLYLNVSGVKQLANENIYHWKTEDLQGDYTSNKPVYACVGGIEIKDIADGFYDTDTKNVLNNPLANDDLIAGTLYEIKGGIRYIGPTDECEYFLNPKDGVTQYFWNSGKLTISSGACPSDAPYCYKGACLKTKPADYETVKAGKTGTSSPQNPSTNTNQNNNLPNPNLVSGTCQKIGGINLFLKGYVSFSNSQEKIYDVCNSPTSLNESYCENGKAIFKTVDCDKGCKEGACLTSSSSSVDSSVTCSGSCSLNGKCYSIGARVSGKFCNSNLQFVSQFSEEAMCENNFECNSNLCLNSKCISSTIFQKFLNWFKRTF